VTLLKTGEEYEIEEMPQGMFLRNRSTGDTWRIGHPKDVAMMAVSLTLLLQNIVNDKKKSR